MVCSGPRSPIRLIKDILKATTAATAVAEVEVEAEEEAEGGYGGGCRSAIKKAKAEALVEELNGTRLFGFRRLAELFNESNFFSRPSTTSSLSMSK